MSKLFRVIIMFESKTARPNIVHLVSFLVKTDKIFRVANEVSQVSVAAASCVRMREIVMDVAGVVEDEDAGTMSPLWPVSPCTPPPPGSFVRAQ